MKEFLSIIYVENAIDRLGLPAFDPAAFPINERHSLYMCIVRIIDDLYDCSIIYEFMRDQPSARAFDAYVLGGL